MVRFLIAATIFLAIAVILPLITYLIVWLSWVKYTNNCLKIFSGQLILKNQFPLILKSHWNKCLAIYSFFLCFFIIVQIGCYLALDYASYIYSVNIVYVFISIIGGVLSYLVISFFCLKHIRKKMSEFGIYDQKTALILFENHQKEFAKRTKISNPKMCEFLLDDYLPKNQITNPNSAFRFNQGKYKRKIKKLKAKGEQKNYEKYQYQLLKIYISYLKCFSWFLIALNKGVYGNFYHVVIDGKKCENLDYLKEVLISNFFAFTN